MFHQAKDLVYKMLTVDTEKRATLTDVLNHPVRVCIARQRNRRIFRTKKKVSENDDAFRNRVHFSWEASGV